MCVSLFPLLLLFTVSIMPPFWSDALLLPLFKFFEVPLEASGLLTPEQCDTLFSRVRVQMLEVKGADVPVFSCNQRV